MKTLVLSLLLAFGSSAMAASWFVVDIVDGEPAVTSKQSGKPHTLGPNEYAASTVFPSVHARYWKKQGGAWVEMSQSQKDKVDSAAKAEIVDAVNTDASLDALIKVIADLHNLSEKQVKDRMVAKIGKDKAHKAKKNRGN
tara:strand:+ start:580 stop:999 length:420 start_codon:yes stop_codon:yes gene_type:complete